MIPHPGLVGETEEGEMFWKGPEGETSTLEEGIINLCDSLKIAAISSPAINGDSIEGLKEDQEAPSSDSPKGSWSRSIL